MRSPYAFHSESDLDRTPVRRCVVDGTPLKGRQERFCSDQCRWAADANSRKAIERVKTLLSRRELIYRSIATVLALAFHFESLPESPGARRGHVATVLDELDLLLHLKGPNHSDVRAYTRARADAIRLAFEVQPTRHPDDARHYVRALEILRDSGMEDPTDRDGLLRYAWAIVNFYHARRDWLNLAKSLQALANVYRMHEEEDQAKQLTRYAWWILSEKFSNSRDPKALTIVHQSAFFDLRLFGDEIDRRDAERKRQQITDLAELVDTPSIWLETHRELAGHFGRDERHGDRAREELRAIEELQSANPGLTTYGAPTLLRPEIELCLGSGSSAQREKGIYLIQGRYLELYKKDRHAYYYRLLKKWREEFRLSFDIPTPVYASAILVHLPR